MRLRKFFRRVTQLVGDERIVDTVCVRNPKLKDELHFWSLSSGHTILARRIGRTWISIERVQEPLGIARNRWTCGGPVRDHEWSDAPVPTRTLASNAKLLASAAAVAKKQNKRLVD